MIHHGGAVGAEGEFENKKLRVLCASAVSPSFCPLVAALPRQGNRYGL